MTTETICRSGDGLFNTPPSCPYPACKDSMCNVCYDDWCTPGNCIVDADESDTDQYESETNKTQEIEEEESVISEEDANQNNDKEKEEDEETSSKNLIDIDLTAADLD